MVKSIEEKFDTLMQACALATEMESRGRLMREHQPKIEIVFLLEDNSIDLCATKQYKQIDIRLVFPDGKVGEAVNWNGMGSTIDEALNGSLWCLRFELEERMKKMEEMLQKLKEVAPFDTEVNSTI